jgi:hypothetical protein
MLSTPHLLSPPGSIAIEIRHSALTLQDHRRKRAITMPVSFAARRPGEVYASRLLKPPRRSRVVIAAGRSTRCVELTCGLWTLKVL